jgi:hypothetical protein
MGATKWDAAEHEALRRAIKARMRDTAVAAAVSSVRGNHRTPAAVCSKARELGLHLKWSSASWGIRTPAEPREQR